MMVLKTAREIDLLRQAGQIAADALSWAGQNAVPGRTTGELDAERETSERRRGGQGHDGNMGMGPRHAHDWVSDVVQPEWRHAGRRRRHPCHDALLLHRGL